MRSKYLLITVYVLLLATPLITWTRGYNSTGGLYEYMRLAGLVAFTLIFLQLVIGAWMLKLRPIFGAGILKLHIRQGLTATVLAFLHPGLYLWQFGWQATLNLGGYYNWGKVGLVILTVTVAAGLLRTAPFLVRHWRWIHRLNYVLLAVVYVHSWNVGSDVRNFPMVLIYWLIPPVLLISIYYKLRPVYNKLHGYN